MLVTFVSACLYRFIDRRYKWLTWELFISLLVEVTYGLSIYHKNPQDYLYHGYVPLQYQMLALYFTTDDTKWRTAIIRSGGWLCAFSLVVSTFIYEFKGFPSVNLNAAAILLTIVCTARLLSLDVSRRSNIWQHPDCWVAIGQMIFFNGSFFMNVVYPYLKQAGRSTVFVPVIFQVLNIVLYTCVLIGLLCETRKSTWLR